MAEDKNIVDVLKTEGIDAAGYGSIPKLVMQDKRLPIQSKAIYAYFNSYAGAGSTAFPGVAKIIFDLGITEDTYRKYFNFLKKYDYIRVEQIRDKGKFKHNIYTIVKMPTPEMLGEKEDSPTPKISGTVKSGTKKSSSAKSSTVDLGTNKKRFNNNNYNIEEEEDSGLAAIQKHIIEQSAKNKLDETETQELIAQFITSYTNKLEKDGEVHNPIRIFQTCLQNYLLKKNIHKLGQFTSLGKLVGKEAGEEGVKKLTERALDRYDERE